MAAPQIKLLIPNARLKEVHAPGWVIKGLYSSSASGALQLLTPARVSKRMDVADEEKKRDFPRGVRDLFPADFVLTSIELTYITAEGERSQEEYNYQRSEQIDLRTFWDAVDFRKILGRVYEPAVYSAEVTLTGWTQRRRLTNPGGLTNHRELFSFTVPLTPGRNSFYLQGLDANGQIAVIDSVVLFYPIEPSDDSPGPGFSRTPFHSIIAEAGCAFCHAEIENEDCSGCHAAFFEHNTIHPPTEEGECTACHDTEADQKNEPIADMRSDTEPCLACHSEKEDDFDSMDMIHPPAEEGCVICHDPHASPYDALLVQPVFMVCTYCHEDITPGEHPVANHPLVGERDPRRPGRKFSCASCHDPHASDHSPLLRDEWFSLCEECHQR